MSGVGVLKACLRRLGACCAKELHFFVLAVYCIAFRMYHFQKLEELETK